jgi:hypothetical protein
MYNTCTLFQMFRETWWLGNSNIQAKTIHRHNLCWYFPFDMALQVYVWMRIYKRLMLSNKSHNLPHVRGMIQHSRFNARLISTQWLGAESKAIRAILAPWALVSLYWYHKLTAKPLWIKLLLCLHGSVGVLWLRNLDWSIHTLSKQVAKQS